VTRLLVRDFIASFHEHFCTTFRWLPPKEEHSEYLTRTSSEVTDIAICLDYAVCRP